MLRFQTFSTKGQVVLYCSVWMPIVRQFLFYFEGSAESGDDNDIVRPEGFKGNELFAMGILEELNAPGIAGRH
jgi:hypothetical protein